jgi:L-phenylalanine/L-methionine N-acetyltransferase
MNTSSERFGSEAGATPRVIVRACEASDMEAVAGITSQPGVRRGTLTMGYRTPDAMASWFAGVPAGSNTDALHMARLADAPSFVQH